ncbi:MAG: hypothetical protein QOF71_841 [Candidatus Eremiobacteraeota bacterium]|nr:hypothetical protein [Candidatus Eremiobacteraeota bacterium]
MVSHAAMPTPLHLGESRFRVYCSGRDAEGRSQIGWFVLDLDRLALVDAVTPQPVLRLGELGAFDDGGVLSSCLVGSGAALSMYYVGLSTGKTVPFRSFTGLAASSDGGASFTRRSRGPILPPDDVDPYFTPLAFVLPEDGRFTMWYTSGIRWAPEAAGPKHYYHIKRADSDDGITWNKAGDVAIDLVGDEYAIARPWVVRDESGYRMWYCFRGDAYRIGYAESPDGKRWTRKDGELGLSTSAEEWENEMVCYPSVFDHGGKRYMLYNGNGYGKGGVGLAVLDGT